MLKLNCATQDAANRVCLFLQLFGRKAITLETAVVTTANWGADSWVLAAVLWKYPCLPAEHLTAYDKMELAKAA